MNASRCKTQLEIPSDVMECYALSRLIYGKRLAVAQDLCFPLCLSSHVVCESLRWSYSLRQAFKTAAVDFFNVDIVLCVWFYYVKVKA